MKAFAKFAEISKNAAANSEKPKLVFPELPASFAKLIVRPRFMTFQRRKPQAKSVPFPALTNISRVIRTESKFLKSKSATFKTPEVERQAKSVPSRALTIPTGIRSESKLLKSKATTFKTPEAELTPKLKLNDFGLRKALHSAYRANNLEVAQKVFKAMRKPNEHSLVQYSILLGKASILSGILTPAIHSELTGVWRKIIDLGYEGDPKLLTIIFKAFSASRRDQRKMIDHVIAKAASEAHNCGLLASFLKYCLSVNDQELAKAIWEWGSGIRSREFGTERFFSIHFQYLKMFGTSVKELQNLWSQIVSSSLNGKVELVNSMCSALAIDNNEQKRFILNIISNPPNPTFDCGFLGGFLKHCTCINDKELASSVWKWGESIRRRESGTFSFFSIAFQYLNLMGTSKEELQNLWSQIVEIGLHGKVELVNSMCSALAIDVNEQKRFILNIISNPPNPTFESGLLSVFLKHCIDANDKELASRVWGWGESIRRKEFGTERFFGIHFQYFKMFGTSVNELQNLWSQIVECGLNGKVELVTAMCSALVTDINEQKRFILNIISNTPNPTFKCGLLGGFLKHCTCINDKELASRVWEWGESLRRREFGTERFFSIHFQYLKMFGTSVKELQNLWSQIVECGLHGKVELVNSMCSALVTDINEQKRFILNIISNPPNPTFNCGLLGVFLKHCTDTDDKELASRVWEWGESIRRRESGTFSFFGIHFQYLKMFGTSVKGLQNLWSQIVSSSLNGKVELVNSMCSALAIDNNEQKRFILNIISNPPNPTFDCGFLGGFLKHCTCINDKELASSVWKWGESIRRRESGTFSFFSIAFQYLNLMGTSKEELQNLWSQIVSSSLNGKVELVNSMCSALAIDNNEQKRFILKIISNPPNPTFESGLLGGFLKHCIDANDKELASSVWKWGESIRRRESGTFSFFSIAFQYLNLMGTSKEELQTLWNQIVECGLHGKVELVTAMCSALVIDINEQKSFILNILSNPPNPTFDCGLLGAFLVPCSIQKNLLLAKTIWSWGLSLREREKGRRGLCWTTIQYLGICSKSGDLDLIESVWEEADRFNLTNFRPLKDAYLSALASNGAIEATIKGVDKVGIDSVSDHILTILLKAFSDAGEPNKALELLRRFQRENPASVHIIPYTSVIDAFCRNGNFESALCVIEEAKSHGHDPDVTMWFAILYSCKKYKNMPVALKAFNEIKSLESDKNRLTKAYNLVTDVCKDCGDDLKASEIHQERLSIGLKHGSLKVDLDLNGTKCISFYVKLLPSDLGFEDSDKIDLQLKEWVPLLESRGFSTEPITKRYGEMLALAYAVAVLKLKEVVLRKDFSISVATHEASRVLSGILGIKIRHWDNVSNKDLAKLHIMTEGKCSCRAQY